jgi:ubiquinone/menaquinone biosynthesis C-methylase UbiE
MLTAAAVLLLGAGLLAGLAAWEVLICEGAHLGRAFVVWMYDLTAARYERIKDFDFAWEGRFLGEPLASTLGELTLPALLDIGAGTGRTARAMRTSLRHPAMIVCLEPSAAMMTLGRRLAPPGAWWVRGWSDPLPFAEGAFDVVTIIEVLEFTPSPERVLAEARRVLRPGGWLLASNRIGSSARWILGKTIRPDTLPHRLEALGFEDVEVYPWQVEYDLAWARKPWAA